MKVRHDMTVTVNTDANKNRTVFIPCDCEYPVTKKEGVEELRSSTQVIICELT